MRRAGRYGLVGFAGLLAAFAVYSGYWLITARRLEDGIARWAQSAHARKVDASWRRIGVRGFPASFRLDLTNVRVRDLAHTPTPEIGAALLTGKARPWDLEAWKIDAPQGIVADLAGAGGRPPLRLAAPRAEGAAAFGAGGTLWLRLEAPELQTGGEVRAKFANLWVTWPARRPRRHDDPNFGLAADLRGVELPALAPVLGERIGELALAATVKGALPPGDLVRSLAVWRDAGGTVDLDHFHVEWSGLGASATGTMALDRDLQPIGAFSGAIEGYDRLLQALVDAGRMRPDHAALARLVLTALAKPGPDGRPQIATSLTVQNGQVFLGPARLGPAPRLAWQWHTPATPAVPR